MFSYNMWSVPVPGAMLPTSKVAFYDDFLTYGGNGTADVTLYLESNAGTVVGTTTAILTEANGVIEIASGTVSGESGIQPNGAVFAMPSGSESLYFEALIKVLDADVANGEVFIGLATPSDVAPIAAATNRIGFLKPAGDATLHTVVDATETATTKDAVDATYFRVAFQATATKILYFIDLIDGNGPIKVGAVEGSSVPAPGTLLQPKAYVGFAAGAGTQILSLDSWLCIADR